MIDEDKLIEILTKMDRETNALRTALVMLAMITGQKNNLVANLKRIHEDPRDPSYPPFQNLIEFMERLT